MGRHPQFGALRRFGGLIDEVRIWNVARTQPQIQADYNSYLTGSEPNLVGYWNFEEGGPNQFAQDLSPFGVPGELRDMDETLDWISPGAIDISPTLLWDWTFGDFNTSNLISPTHGYGTADTYLVTVMTTEPDGCLNYADLEVTITSLGPGAIALGADTTLCQGDSLLLEVATPGLNYAWSTGPTTQSIYAQAGGTYWVDVSDSTGCISSDTIVIGAFSLPVVDLGADTAICEYNDLLLDAGNPGNSWLWSTGATTQTLLVDTAGTFTVEVTDANSCVGTDQIVVTESIVNAATSPAGLVNLCPTSYVDFTASGGVSYRWWDATTGVVNDSIQQSGNFWVIATDAVGCEDTAFFSVNLLTPSTTVSLSGDTVLCPGESVNMSSSFGLSYNWSTGATTRDIVVNTPGTYYVDMVDPDGCPITSDTIEITTDTPSVTTIAQGDTAYICLDGSTLLTASGGTQFLWSNGATTASISVTQPDSFSVIGTNVNGCRDTSATTQTLMHPRLVTIANLGDTVLCPGDSTDLQAGSGSGYNWSFGGNTQNIRSGQTGPVWVTYTDLNGCSATTDTLTIHDAPVVVLTVSGAQDVCPGDSVVLRASGAASYLWSEGSTADSLVVDTSGNYFAIGYAPSGCSDTSAVQVINQLVPAVEISVVAGDTFLCPFETVTLAASAGTGHIWNNGATGDTITVDSGFAYTVTMVDTQGCTFTSAPQIVNTPPGIPITFTPAAPWRVCPGDTLEVTASGGGTYTWSTGDNTPSTQVSSPGQYEVRVESAQGCRDTAVGNLVYFTPTATISGPDVICFGDSASLTASTGTNYAWFNGDTTRSIQVTSSGAYAVSLVDSNGCAATSAPFLVDVQPLPNAHIDVTGLYGFCPGDFLEMVASGGDNYLWSTGDTLDTLFTNVPGPFYVVAFTNEGCVDTSDVEMVEIFIPYAEILGDTQLCAGDTVTLTANAGSNYLWSTGETTQSIEVDLQGAYTVSLLDSNGCSGASDSVTVIPDFPPTAIITPSGPTTFCPGDSVVLTASGGEVLTWSNGETAPSISVAISGGFSVIVVDSSGGCRDTSAVTTTSLLSPSASITSSSGVPKVCPGSPLTLTASVGTGWLWSTGATAQSIQITTPGLYSVSVTDTNGCMAQANITITTGTNPTANITPTGTTTVCPGQPVNITASGGISYQWSNGAITSSISPVAPGDYSVVVTNNAGCKDTSVTVTLANHTPLAAITPSGPTALCPGDSVILTASTGANYLWSSGQNTPSITVSTPGVFTVTLLDANGCVGTSPAVSVTQLAPPNALITPGGNVGVCPNDSVELTASGGSSYLWSTGATTPTVWVNGVDTLSVIATGTNGCLDTSGTVTTFLRTPIASITASGPLQFCPGNTVTLTASTGTNFVWSTGATTQSIVVGQAGTYTVTLDDPNGCEATSAPVNTTHFTPPTAGISPAGSSQICPGTSQTFTASGGVSYQWSTGASGSTISVGTAGSYSVVAIDGNGCRDTSVASVLNLHTPVATITPLGPTTICNGDSVILQASAGTNYLWSTGATTSSIVVKTPGAYTVSLIDPNGCAATSAPRVVVVRQPALAGILPAGSRNICPGDSLTFTASGGVSYQWSTGATGPSLTVDTTGSYYVIGTDAYGCRDTSVVSTIGYYTPFAQISPAGPVNHCPGGTSTLTASVGSNFLWSNGATTPVIHAADTGSYTVTLTDPNGCRATSAPVQVNHFTSPVATVSPAGTATVCPGDSLLLTAGGGVSYQWSTGASGTNIFVSDTTGYFVIATDANGCRDTSTTLDLAHFTPVATISASGPRTFCPGDSVIFTASAGTNYLWSTGETTPSVTIFDPGNYAVSLTDPNGCAAVSDSLNVRHWSAPTALITPSNPAPVCPGDSTLLHGVGGVSYQWSNGATGNTVQLPAGTWSVVATNSRGCKDTSATVTVTNHTPQASIIANGPTSFCPGDSVTLTASTGSNFVWSNGATTQSIRVGQAGSYTVTLEDPNGCTATSAPLNVSLLTPPVAGISPAGTTTICPGGSQVFTGSGGVSYIWSTGTTGANFTATAAADYQVIAIDANGCRDTSASATLNWHTPTATITAGGPTTFCNGSSVVLTASAGSNFLWSTGETTQSIVASDPGAYTVTLIDPNGCVATSAPVIITLLPDPMAGISPVGNRNICPGDSLTFSATGGVSYLWSTGETGPSISVNSPGSVFVIAFNAAGCGDTSTVVNVGLFTPTASISPAGPVTICPEGSTTLTASAGSNFLWSNGATTPAITVADPGSYFVTLRDVNGCQATSASVTVNEFTSPVATINQVGNDSVCPGDSLLLVAGGGGSYAWLHGPTTDSVYVSTVGAYSVVVTDGNGCRDTSASLDLGFYTPTASITASGATTFCPGDSVSLTASAGSNYLWSTGETTPSVTVSDMGSYTVSLTDPNGCAAGSAPIVVTHFTPPSAGISIPDLPKVCPGDSLLMTAGGGVSYVWSTGSTGDSLWGMGGNTYTVVATDANGCADTSAGLSIVNYIPVANITPVGPTTICREGSVILIASNGSNFLWSNGDTAQSIVVSQAGSYSVSMNDGNGCAATSAPISISHLPAPTATISPMGTTEICPGGSQVYTAGGGTNYLWSTGSNGPTATFTNAGNYSVIAIDGNGCRDTSAMVTLAITTPVVNVTPQGPTTFCAGDSVVLTASAGSNYFWSNGDTTPSITVYAPGVYTVTMQDTNGCFGTSAPVTVTLRQQPTASVNPTGNRSICPGDSLLLTASGGVFYQWSTGASGGNLRVNTPGSYYVVAADAFGCTDTSATVNVSLFTPTASISPAGPLSFCPGDSVLLTASAGSNFLWSNGDTTPGIQVHSAGTYSVTLTDVNGCSATASPVTVNALAQPIASLTPAGAVSICPGDSLLLTAGGGISYQWSHGPGGVTTPVSAPGTYSVIVTDGNGCRDTSSTLSLSHFVPSTSITASGPTAFCPGDSVVLTAGPGSNYNWSTGATTASITVTAPGNYSVTQTDVNGCAAAAGPVPVSHYARPTASLSPVGTRTICPGDSLLLTAGGGTSFLWSTGDTGPNLYASTVGTYSVTVFNANGCADTSANLSLGNHTPVATI